MGTGIHRYRFFALAAALLASLAVASDTPPMAGSWERVAESDFLLRDPFTAQPAALMSDPSARLLSSGSGIIHGPRIGASPGLPVVTVRDKSPEFWAEPVAWNYLGPAAYSGFGRDIGPREWAGRPALDRRAYALDPGWRHEALVAPASAGAGTIAMTIDRAGAHLRWRAQGGRIYVVEFTSSLSRGFSPVRTIHVLADEDVSVTLPRETVHGFYRVAEQIY